MTASDLDTVESEFLKLYEARTDFRAYLRQTVLSRPGYVAGEHIGVLSELAQSTACTPGARSIISLPPRHMKSTIFSEALPAWYISAHPQNEVIIASYNQTQARKILFSIRSIMDSVQHKRVFPHQRLVLDTADAIQLDGKVNGRPSIIAAGVGSGITGSGADLGIIDDIVKDMMDATSPIIRQRTWDWFLSTFLTRLSPGASVAFIGTRWHPDDPIGRILAGDGADGWTAHMMPAIDCGGHALWPERYTAERLSQIRDEEVGPVVFETLYQCNPVPPHGVLVYEEGIDWEVVRSDAWPSDLGTPARLGVDWGWNNHATGAVWPRGKNLFVRTIQFLHNWRLRDIFADLRNICDGEGWDRRTLPAGCDSAEPGSTIEMRTSGFPGAYDAPKSRVGVSESIGQVRERRLMVHEDDAELISELRNYRWDPSAMEKDMTYTPMKGADHIVDALRYALMYVPSDTCTKVRVRRHVI